MVRVTEEEKTRAEEWMKHENDHFIGEKIYFGFVTWSEMPSFFCCFFLLFFPVQNSSFFIYSLECFRFVCAKRAGTHAHIQKWIKNGFLRLLYVKRILLVVASNNLQLLNATTIKHTRWNVRGHVSVARDLDLNLTRCCCWVVLTRFFRYIEKIRKTTGISHQNITFFMATIATFLFM